MYLIFVAIPGAVLYIHMILCAVFGGRQLLAVLIGAPCPHPTKRTQVKRKMVLRIIQGGVKRFCQRGANFGKRASFSGQKALSSRGVMTYLDQFPPGKRSVSFVEGMELKFLRELFFLRRITLKRRVGGVSLGLVAVGEINRREGLPGPANPNHWHYRHFTFYTQTPLIQQVGYNIKLPVCSQNQTLLYHIVAKIL